MDTKSFNLTYEAKLSADKHGLNDTVLSTMLRHSARVTHKFGNRRYHDFIFEIQGSTVFSICKVGESVLKVVEVEDDTDHIKCMTCKDAGKIPVFNECQHCSGVGCAHCDEGLVRGFITCPDCGGKAHTKFTGKGY